MLVDKVTTRVFKSGTCEKIRKVLDDGTVFTTIRKTALNGDVFSKTKKNGKTILTIFKQNLPICGNNESQGTLYTKVKRFLHNGDTSTTERFVNYLKGDVLSFLERRNQPIIPTMKKFPTKEVITETDLYSHIFGNTKRIFTGFYQDSPIGQAGQYTYIDKKGVEQQLNVYSEKFREIEGKFRPSNLKIRYFK